MKGLSLQITYRKGKALAAYIYLSSKPGRKSARTERVGSGLVVDFGSEDEPLGIEVVSPSVVTLEDLQRVLEKLGLERPDPTDLEPLLAA